jgi:hypothetical protein
VDSVVVGLNPVFRDKFLMRAFRDGRRDAPDTLAMIELARRDRAWRVFYPPEAHGTFTQGKRMRILEANICWEHYLANYTNYDKLRFITRGGVTSVLNIQFLFPLPAKWPWSVAGSVDTTVGDFTLERLPEMRELWRDEHAHLMGEAGVVVVL